MKQGPNDPVRLLVEGPTRSGFAADLVDGLAQRSVEDLRVHVQCRIDIGMTHQLPDNLPGHTSIDHDDVTIASGLGGGLANRYAADKVPTGGPVWRFALMPE